MKGQTLAPRDHTLDIVRGIAIVTMVGANLAILLPEPHSPAIRWYSSFAAPIFVTLAGAMMARVVNRNQDAKHPLSYFIKRGLFLITVAALIDVVAWRFIPFMGFDVLYLLGFSLPILFLCAYLSSGLVLLLAATTFVMTPILQNLLGYISVPSMVDIIDWRTLATVDFRQVAKHWLVDGWFPIFPWLGYGLFGVYLGKYRWHGEAPIVRFASFSVAGVATFSFVLGMLVMAENPGPMYVRDGFSELFYPASIGFIIVSLSVVVGFISLIDYCPSLRVWSVFRLFGEASLFMYAAHSIIIGSVLLVFWEQASVIAYAVIYACLIVLLCGCGFGLRQVRNKHPNLPVIVKWVIGG